MFRFLLGVCLGALGAYLWRTQPSRMDVEGRFREFQSRTNAVVGESRRIVEEARGELGQALEVGRESMQHKADRLKSAATTGRTSGGNERSVGGATT